MNEGGMFVAPIGSVIAADRRNNSSAFLCVQ
jgi:hypothetical protein